MKNYFKCTKCGATASCPNYNGTFPPKCLACGIYMDEVDDEGKPIQKPIVAQATVPDVQPEQKGQNKPGPIPMQDMGRMIIPVSINTYTVEGAVMFSEGEYVRLIFTSKAVVTNDKGELERVSRGNVQLFVNRQVLARMIEELKKNGMV